MSRLGLRLGARCQLRRPLPETLAASVSLGLAGFAATAFGVAPMAPDAAALPKRLVTESVATATSGRSSTRSPSTTSSSSAATSRAPATPPIRCSPAWASATWPPPPSCARDPTARKLLDGRAGKRVQVRVDATGQLEELVARYAAPGDDKLPTQFTRLRVERVAGKLVAYSTLAPLTAQPLLASGTVRTSLFAATDDAGIPDAVATQIAEIFATDIDFRRELKQGRDLLGRLRGADRRRRAGHLGPGRRPRARRRVRQQGPDAIRRCGSRTATARARYFGLDGQSKQRSFLASPLEFSRVTSGFAMRMHPILNTWKQHNGVDYGAPTGTPVRTIGDGVVEFAGWQNGYGNVVHVKHNNDRIDGLRAPEPDRRRQGRRSVEPGRTHRRRRQDRLGDRPAPALRVQGRRRPAGSAAHRPVLRSAVLTPPRKARFARAVAERRAQLGVAQTLARRRSRRIARPLCAAHRRTGVSP